MKGIEIRDFMGDYALDIPMGEGCVHTIYFNSRRNAEMVKRIMEVDDSVPNAATVCDVVEVVHGEWKPCYEDWRKQIEGDECSACGFRHYGTSIRHYHYCPNCGAKMDATDNNVGDKEEEEA